MKTDTQITANASFVTKDTARRIALAEKLTLREWAGRAICAAINAYAKKRAKGRKQ